MSNWTLCFALHKYSFKFHFDLKNIFNFYAKFSMIAIGPHRQERLNDAKTRWKGKFRARTHQRTQQNSVLTYTTESVTNIGWRQSELRIMGFPSWQTTLVFGDFRLRDVLFWSSLAVSLPLSKADISTLSFPAVYRRSLLDKYLDVKSIEWCHCLLN